MTEVWPTWPGEVINGVYPLRHLLNGSDHGAVFLTECKAQNVPNAAIKFVPAERVLTEAQLSHWRMAAGLSHPHLIRLLDVGHCQPGPDSRRSAGNAASRPGRPGFPSTQKPGAGPAEAGKLSGGQ